MKFTTEHARRPFAALRRALAGALAALVLCAAVPLAHAEENAVPPGTAPSAAQAVHVVTVKNGTGGGRYAEGETVTLTADDRPGYRFTGWTLEGAGAADTAKETLTFTMPGGAVMAEANYVELFIVTASNGIVLGGTHSGTTSSMFAPGEEVTVALDAPEGSEFIYWITNLMLSSEQMTSPKISFVMPNYDVQLTANFMTMPSMPFPVSVMPAKGSGTYMSGTVVMLVAPEREGERFAAWEFNGVDIEKIEFIEGDKNSPLIRFIMPNNNINGYFHYVPLYTVTVENGTLAGGGREITGQYAEGDTVGIQVDADKRLLGWTFTPGSVQAADAVAASTVFAMPGQDVTARAEYVQLYPVTVKGGTGGGQYAAGDRVTLTAEVPAGHKFDGWTFSPEVSFLDGTNAGSATVVFTMPEAAVTAEAVASPQVPDKEPASPSNPAPAPGAGQKPNPKTGVDGWQAFWQGVRDLLGL
ncbi:MAG: InlB B-repeat-containing protein [Ruthenibacterium sp.]